MSDRDAYSGEGAGHEGMSDEEVEGHLSGRQPEESGNEELAQYLSELKAAYSKSPSESTRRAHLAAIARAVQRPAAPEKRAPLTPRRRSPRVAVPRKRLALLIAAIVLGILLLAAALAVAGVNLPGLVRPPFDGLGAQSADPPVEKMPGSGPPAQGGYSLGEASTLRREDRPEVGVEQILDVVAGAPLGRSTSENAEATSSRPVPALNGSVVEVASSSAQGSQAVPPAPAEHLHGSGAEAASQHSHGMHGSGAEAASQHSHGHAPPGQPQSQHPLPASQNSDHGTKPEKQPSQPVPQQSHSSGLEVGGQPPQIGEQAGPPHITPTRTTQRTQGNVG